MRAARAARAVITLTPRAPRATATALHALPKPRWWARATSSGATPPSSSGSRSTRPLTADEIKHYHQEGWVIVRSMFTAPECDLLLRTIEADAAISANEMHMKDAEGRVSKLTLWNDAGDDTYGMFARGERWVSAARALIGCEPYHFHTKIMLKAPRVGGKWEWHQDFGYWYQVGCLNPDRMFSSILAIDAANKANGCLQVLSGTHRLGRIDHGQTGQQAGANLRRVEQALKIHPLVHCEMTPGDVLFTHSNLLHMSQPNTSPHWRRSMIVAYNGVDNDPWTPVAPSYSPMRVVPDSAILERGVVPHAARHAKPGSAHFLDTQTNIDTYSKGSA